MKRVNYFNLVLYIKYNDNIEISKKMNIIFAILLTWKEDIRLTNILNRRRLLKIGLVSKCSKMSFCNEID